MKILIESFDRLVLESAGGKIKLAAMNQKIAIDLGTTSTIVLSHKGIVVNEPTVVALSAEDQSIMAIGGEAKKMLGKTPESIIASYPLREGVIANYRTAQALIRILINRVSGAIRFLKPDLMVTIPSGVTSTERRAVIDACLSAGARNCYVIKDPVAAALGAGIDISSPTGHMVIDIGGGTTDVAVLSLGDIVSSASVRVGGNHFDQAITDFIRKKYNLIIGEQTAEEVKIAVGSVGEEKKNLQMEVSGSNSISGLPESVIVKTSDIAYAVKGPLSDIIATVKVVLQKTPPELASDIMGQGIVMTGGGSMLRQIDALLTKVTGVPCQVSEDPLLAVARGAGVAVENLDSFRKSVLWTRNLATN